MSARQAALEQPLQAVEALATETLWNSSHPALRSVNCRLCDGVLVLSGTVPTYYQKQVAQGLVLHLLEGMAVIHNAIVVESAHQAGGEDRASSVTEVPTTT